MPSGARRRGGFAGIPAGLLLGLDVEFLAQPESCAVSGLGIRPWKVDGIDLVALFCSSALDSLEPRVEPGRSAEVHSDRATWR